jgi:hypothetical protein
LKKRIDKLNDKEKKILEEMFADKGKKKSLADIDFFKDIEKYKTPEKDVKFEDLNKV